MANGCCTNALCADRETQLRLARLREELLTNFNTLLLDRIRFLEQTINQLSSSSSLSPQSAPIPTTTSPPPTKTTTSACINITSTLKSTDRLSTPSTLRRSSSTTVYFLQNPTDQNLPENVAAARSCPSSVDLSTSKDRRRFFSSKKFSRSQNRASSESGSHYLSIPMDAQWSTLTNDLGSTTNVNNEKGRLESRRFACDVDDNEVRAFKAMIYMEQARKQHARPLTRLRQALGISTNSSTGSYTFNNPKKHSNA